MMLSFFRQIWFRRLKWAIALFCAVLAIGLTSGIAQADGLRYPHSWFTFTDASPHGIRQGVQLVWCQLESCRNPILISQFGECYDPGCLKKPRVQTDDNALANTDLTCRGNTCLAVCRKGERYNYCPVNEVQLIVQFSDRLRVSNLTSFFWDSYDESYITQDWSVTVNDSDLSIELKSIAPESHDFSYQVKLSIGITLSIFLVVAWFIELCVAFAYLRRSPATHAATRKILTTIGMSNILMAPVWCTSIIFPFQTNSYQKLGIVCFILAVLYALIWKRDRLLLGRNHDLKKSICRISSSLLLIAFMFPLAITAIIWYQYLILSASSSSLFSNGFSRSFLGLCLFGLLIAYVSVLINNPPIPTMRGKIGCGVVVLNLYSVGLFWWFLSTQSAPKIFNTSYYWVSSPWLITLVLVVLYEAWLIALFNRSEVSWRQAVILSLLTNGVNLGWGWVLLRILQSLSFVPYTNWM